MHRYHPLLLLQMQIQQMELILVLLLLPLLLLRSNIFANGAYGVALRIHIKLKICSQAVDVVSESAHLNSHLVRLFLPLLLHHRPHFCAFLLVIAHQVGLVRRQLFAHLL